MRYFMHFFICLLVSYSLLGQSIDSPYVYPVRPGTWEWKNYRYPELRKVLQISPEMIKNMSTTVLLQSVLNYPLIGDLLVFRSYREGLESLRKNFSALDSLMNRQDLAMELSESYKRLDAAEVQHLIGAIEIGEFMLRLSLLEMLCTTENVATNLGNSRRMLLLDELKAKYEQKNVLVHIYGNIGLSTCLWAIANIITDDTGYRQLNAAYFNDGYNLSIGEINSIKVQIFSTIKSN
jgi:hypothetical protein